MGSNRKAARSRGDVMKRLDDLEAEIEHLKTARRLPNSSYASGGVRTRGGRFLAEDLTGDKVFEVTTEPPDIFMRPELIATVARQVIGESVLTQTVDEFGNRTAVGTFGDLELSGTASPGPSISFELEGEAILAIWGSAAGVSSADDISRTEAFMDVEIDGPTTYTPDNGSFPFAAALELGETLLAPDRVSAAGSALLARKFDLDPGSYTVTAKYRVDGQGNVTTLDATWSRRWLIVIVF